jgi:hypothetical protein
MNNAGRPQPGEYGSYYQRYIDHAPEEDIVAALDAQARETAVLFDGLSEQQAAERIFAYRALSIARGETKALPGFDQEPYVVNSGADERAMSDLAGELAAVRRANVMMFRALSDEAWRRIGTASDNPISVRALAYIMLGHERHHMSVLRDRYLGSATPRTA